MCNFLLHADIIPLCVQRFFYPPICHSLPCLLDIHTPIRPQDISYPTSINSSIPQPLNTFNSQSRHLMPTRHKPQFRHKFQYKIPTLLSLKPAFTSSFAYYANHFLISQICYILSWKLAAILQATIPLFRICTLTSFLFHLKKGVKDCYSL